MDEKEIFEKHCFLPCWNENVKKEVQRKDLTTLLAELEDIKNHIEQVQEKEWFLGKLMNFHKMGVAH